MLLAVGAGVAVLALSYFGAFKPALDWRRDAALTAKARETEFRLVADAAGAAAEGGAADGAQTPVRNALTEAAAQAGVDLVFVNARDDGSVETQITSAAPEKLFAMIESLEGRYGVRVAAADIARAADGAADVRAQLTLSR